MKLSDEETALLTDIDDPKGAAEALLRQGVKCVVVTMGKDGAMLVTDKVRVQAPAQTRKVVDTTGAGDSFWGGLLSRFAEFHVNPADISESQAGDFLRYATIVAGLCVEKRGAIPAMPYRKEVEEIYNLRLDKF